MKKNLLELMKEIAPMYGIEIVENALKGGIFYKDETNNLVEISKQRNCLIVDDFCTIIGEDLKRDNAVYAVEYSVTFAA